MMGAFLDALGIKHENGLIDEDDVQARRREDLAPAVAQARRRVSAGATCALHLQTLICQDPETWGELRTTRLGQ